MKGLNLVHVRVWINNELSSRKNNYTSTRVNEMKKTTTTFFPFWHINGYSHHWAVHIWSEGYEMILLSLHVLSYEPTVTPYSCVCEQ